jgi:Ser/Thr protein kinase RdoA (MazF antagonist)
MQKEFEILSNFALDGTPISLKPLGCGHINSTFLVKCDNGNKYNFQKINNHVFKDVDALMNNIDSVTSFLKEKTIANGGNPDRETLTVVKTKDGKNYYKENDDAYWRVYLFVDDVITLQVIENPEHFYYAGKAFGNFQKLLADFPAEKLAETIPNFHNTVSRYADFEAQIAANRSGRANEAEEEIAFARKYKWLAEELYPLIAKGELPLRVTHNDTKLNNVLLDKETGKPVCVIDLDTVMPGLSLYDYGDSMRFGTNPAAEDEKDLSKVYSDLVLFEEYTKGFLEECGAALTKKEIELLPISALVMTYECGIRFLADFVDGDHYFHTERPEHNLDRARTQFKLVADMEAKLPEMKAIVAKYI